MSKVNVRLVSMSKVIITLTNSKTDYDLEFDVLDLPIAQRWLSRVKQFEKAGQPLDDPGRFYNFPNNVWTQPKVVQHLKHLVAVINDYQPVATRPLGDVLSQDDLNYLHHVFEVYHGLYDDQSQNEFFSSAPAAVQKALADLNIWIHRYETLGGIPRFVCTWFNQGERDHVLDHEYDLFTLRDQWGDLRLNYCEIGKTLFDHWHDHDDYIKPEAFKPLSRFGFDFTVRFSDRTDEYWDQVEQGIWEYFDGRKEFFHSLGYHKHDPRLALGSITVARLNFQDRDQVLHDISQHQHIKCIRSI